MNYVRCITTACLPVILASFIGCTSKQDKSGSNTGAPPQSASAPAVPPQNKSASPAVQPQDKADAQASSVRILALLERGDFPAIYKDSAASFKQIGSESQFVAKFQQTRQSVGVLKNPREQSFGTLPDNVFVFTYRLENDHYISDIRLSFVRSRSGKMELAGINQHDEQKK